MRGISIKDIFRVSVETYKERWKTLLLISLISELITVLISFITIVSDNMEFSALQVLFSLLGSIVLLVSVYYGSRLTVALIVSSDESQRNEASTVKNSYRKAKPMTWRYIGFSIIFGCMVFIPVVLIFLGSLAGRYFEISVPIRIFMFCVGIIPAIYLYTTFHFSLFTAVIYPDESKIFNHSKKLVKGNFVEVFIIMAVPIVVTVSVFASNQLLQVDQYDVYIQLVFSVIRVIPLLLITPFGVLLSLETMRRLENLKDIEADVIG